MSLFDNLFHSEKSDKKSGKAASLFAEDSTFAVRRQAGASVSAADLLAVKHGQHLERGEADASTEPLTRQQAPAGQPAGTEASSETPKKLKKGKLGASAAKAAAAAPVPAQVAASIAQPPPGKKRKREKPAAESAASQPAQPATRGPVKQSAERPAESAAEPAASQQVQAPASGSHAGHSAKGQVKGAVEPTGPPALAGKATTGAHAEAQRPTKRAKGATKHPVSQQAPAAAELPAARSRSKQLKAAVKAARAAADGDEEAGADPLASAGGSEQGHRHAGEVALAAADAAADSQPSAAAGSGEQVSCVLPSRGG